MNASDTNKKYKRPKRNTTSTTKPEATKPKNDIRSPTPPLCPLLAKDSEWVDILQNTPGEASTSGSVGTIHEEEAVLQLVECEDGPQMKPLAIMFPDLIEKDPQTLEGVMNKVMSTTEVTKHLVDLGQKANFTCMRKANRLIPREKQWLERVMEDNTQSRCSTNSSFYGSSVSSDYDADTELLEDEFIATNARRRLSRKSDKRELADCASEDTLAGMEHATAELSIRERPNHAQEKCDIAWGE